MAKFEIGNQWWKNRAKSGRDAMFTDPEILRQSIQEYFDLTDQRRDWDGQEWIGGQGLDTNLIELYLQIKVRRRMFWPISWI